MPGMKWSCVFEMPPLSGSIGMRTGAPKLGFGFPSVGAGIMLMAMSFGSDDELLATLFFVTKAPLACGYASAGVIVAPWPPLQAVLPTDWIVTTSGCLPFGSIRSVWPAARPEMLASLTQVAPAVAAAVSVVFWVRKLRVCQTT